MTELPPPDFKWDGSRPSGPYLTVGEYWGRETLEKWLAEAFNTESRLDKLDADLLAVNEKIIQFFNWEKPMTEEQDMEQFIEVATVMGAASAQYGDIRPLLYIRETTIDRPLGYGTKLYIRNEKTDIHKKLEELTETPLTAHAVEALEIFYRGETQERFKWEKP